MLTWLIFGSDRLGRIPKNFGWGRLGQVSANIWLGLTQPKSAKANLIKIWYQFSWFNPNRN